MIHETRKAENVGYTVASTKARLAVKRHANILYDDFLLKLTWLACTIPGIDLNSKVT